MTAPLDLLALMRPLVEQEEQTLLAPLLDEAQNLRLALEAIVAEASAHAGNAALAAVVRRAGGTTPEEAPDQRAIDEAIFAICRARKALLKDQNEGSASELEDAASSLAGPEPAPEPVSEPVLSPASFRPPVDEATYSHGQRLVEEANTLFDDEMYWMHELRLGPLCQAIVAEIRDVLRAIEGSGPVVTPPAPRDEGLATRLHAVLRSFTTHKRGDRPHGYVCGLSYKDAMDPTIDWTAMAGRARTRVRTFDEDAARGEPAKIEKGEKSERGEKKSPVIVPAEKVLPPAWTALRAASKDGVVLVVGNTKSHKDREADARERLELSSVEWCNVDNDKNAARKVDSLAARIAGNNVVAVVILEGFVDHRTTKKIENACLRAPAPVPYAYGGKGGRREFEDALSELDRKLGSLALFGAESAVENTFLGIDVSRAKIARVLP